MAYLYKAVENRLDEVQAQARLNGIRAIQRVEIGANGKDTSGKCTEEIKWMFACNIASVHCFNGGTFLLPDAKDECMAFFSLLAAQPASKKMPFELYMVNMVRLGLFDKWLDADLVGAADVSVANMNELCEIAESFDDAATVDKISFVCGGFDFALTHMTCYAARWNWTVWEPVMDLMQRAVDAYNYDVHHAWMKEAGQDFCCVQPMGSAMIWHRGALSVFWNGFEMHKDNCIRLSREPDQKSENTTYLYACGGWMAVMSALVCREDLGAEILNILGFTWSGARHVADRLGPEVFVRDRGVSEKATMYFFSAEGCEFCMKASYLLVTKCSEVDVETVIQFLPTIEEMLYMNDVNSSGGAISLMFMCEGFLMSALLCEMIGESERALQFLEYLIDLDDTEPIDSQSKQRRYKMPTGPEVQARIKEGRDPKFTSQILGKCTPLPVRYGILYTQCVSYREGHREMLSGSRSGGTGKEGGCVRGVRECGCSGIAPGVLSSRSARFA